MCPAPAVCWRKSKSAFGGLRVQPTCVYVCERAQCISTSLCSALNVEYHPPEPRASGPCGAACVRCVCVCASVRVRVRRAPHIWAWMETLTESMCACSAHKLLTFMCVRAFARARAPRDVDDARMHASARPPACPPARLPARATVLPVALYTL